MTNLKSYSHSSLQAERKYEETGEKMSGRHS